MLAGEYEIGEELSRGVFGTVHRAKRMSDGAKVSVREQSCETKGAFHDALNTLLRTKRTGEHLVPYLQCFAKGGDGSTAYRIYTVMPQYDESLQQRLASGPMQCKDVTRLLWQMCSALASLHKEDKPGNQIRPTNIYCVSRGKGIHDYYLGDVGLGKVGPSDLVTAGAGEGLYVPREQQQCSLKSMDVYALGVTVCQAGTSLPWVAGLIDAKSKGYTLTQVTDEISTVLGPVLGKIIGRMLAEDYDRLSAAEILKMLDVGKQPEPPLPTYGIDENEVRELISNAQELERRLTGMIKGGKGKSGKKDGKTSFLSAYMADPPGPRVCSTPGCDCKGRLKDGGKKGGGKEPFKGVKGGKKSEPPPADPT